ncbi:MAG: hypothetical protein L0I79_01750 [Atopostipes sp.]|nr:hypothetical protein [Atopostipes sp.]
MKNKRFWSDWLFPIISLVTFASLLAAILVDMNSIDIKTLLSYSSGLLAFTMMLTVTFMASRPRFLEKIFGMPEMYEVHAIMSIVLSILSFIHIFIQWNGLQWITDMSIVSQTGWGATLSLIIVMFTGIFSISGIIVDQYEPLRHFKNKLNREVNLWLHRLAIVAIIAVYFHMFFLPFLRNNILFMILVTTYTVAVLVYYLGWKFKIALSSKYKVKKIYKATPSLWVVEFEPVAGRTMESYRAGDYFFIRFKGDADITKEGHPFSTSSAMTKRYSNSIEFMIKEAGDWTESLANINVGDIATFEGPYGNYLPEEVEETPEEDVPYILLGGGIGLTPNLSVLRHEVENNSKREIHLFWGLAYEEDMFMLDELEEAKRKLPNFNYHIIFSNEEVEGYPFGFIDHDYLKSVGADHYRDGHFFVCGPGPMLNGMRKLLADGNVPYDQIHLDDFGF